MLAAFAGASLRGAPRPAPEARASRPATVSASRSQRRYEREDGAGDPLMASANARVHRLITRVAAAQPRPSPRAAEAARQPAGGARAVAGPTPEHSPQSRTIGVRCRPVPPSCPACSALPRAADAGGARRRARQPGAATTPWGDLGHFGELESELKHPEQAFGVNPEDGSVWVVDVTHADPKKKMSSRLQKFGDQADVGTRRLP